MASVLVQQSPISSSFEAMSSTRRVPLASNNNAVNSPFRAVAAAAQKQQKRSYANVQREEAYGQPPPAKRQLIEPSRRSPTKTSTSQLAEDRLFSRRPNGSQPTAFEKKLEAAKSRNSIQSQQVVVRAEKHSKESLETIRQWQRHYRRAFPSFVFYFESVPEEARLRYVRQLQILGAREEKFFSNSVTHVVTTRTIPPPLPPSPVDTPVDSHTSDAHSQGSHVQTINPLLLDRSSESSAAQFDGRTGKNKFTFEVPLSRRATTHAQEHDARRQQPSNSIVLDKARDLGMKIWALDKLGRMMTTMFDTDTGLHLAHGHNTRSATAETSAISRSTRNADLSQMLRQERVNGPSDRDPTVASKDMVIFKGPFIYIHDIDEKQRPIMVREYAKVSNKEDGDWPQFRSVANGKCPFVEEIDHDRREQERELLRQQRHAERERAAAAPRTRAAAAEALKMQPPKLTRSLSQTMESGSQAALSARPSEPAVSTKSIEPEASSTRGPHHNAFVSRAAQGRLLGGEPVASGLQQSNITSAIRSQMISSTAAVPGVKAGTSKEVHGLQRKVLERASGPTSLGHTSSHRMTDVVVASLKEDARRATTKNNHADEGTTAVEHEEAQRADIARKAKANQKRKLDKRDPKPGYCENCMDKFEDFDEHIQARKHRKFAEKKENWAELDALLAQLHRPLKVERY